MKSSTALSRIDARRALTVLLENGANPTIEDKKGLLPLDYFKDPKLFDPTVVFLFIRCMLTTGF